MKSDRDNLKSKPVQLVACGDMIAALCEDGSIWGTKPKPPNIWTCLSSPTASQPEPVSIPVDPGPPELSKYDSAVRWMSRLLSAPVYERHHVASDGQWQVVPAGMEPNWNNPELEFKLGTFEWLCRTWVGHMQGDRAPRLEPGTKVLPLYDDLKFCGDPTGIEQIYWDAATSLRRGRRMSIVAYSTV